jgi:tRNA pseudouridine55 synthase
MTPRSEPSLMRNLTGFLVVNKPTGMTSHDVVTIVRRKFHMRRVGHAGTLDPMATGVLVVLLGKNTKLFSQFEGFDKAYRATLILGTQTSTADIQGKVLQQAPYEHFTRDQIEQTLKKFVGVIAQTPPMVSAIKFKGQRLYELARKGIVVDRKPRMIRISKLELVDFQLPRVTIYLECSKGTYVRQLAEDIGKALESYACIAEIERTQVGPFQIHDAINLSALEEKHVRQWTQGG